MNNRHKMCNRDIVMYKWEGIQLSSTEREMFVVLESYVERTSKVISSVLGEYLSGLYLTGSAAFDDITDKSDVDIIVVVSESLLLLQKQALAEKLRHDVLPCPFAGLELIVVGKETSRRPGMTATYEFAMDTGENWGNNVLYGGVEKELLLEFAICRQYGRTLIGPPPTEVFGKVSRAALLSVLLDILREHENHVHHPFHDPYGHYAVLNACRAYRYFKTGELCSKTEAGKWAMSQGWKDPVIEQALAIRMNRFKEKLSQMKVKSFLKNVRRILDQGDL